MTESSTTTTTVEERRRLLARLLSERGEGARTGPVSFAQRRLWIIDRLLPGNSGYNVPIVFVTAHAPDRAALGRAAATVIERHEVLRTVFVTTNGVPLQQVRRPFRPEVWYLDLSAGPASRPRAERELRDWANHPFDLQTGPLLRVGVVKVADDEYLLGLAVHHIACDGWSVATLLREVDSLYLEYTAGVQARLPALPAQYLDYAIWQRNRLSPARLEELVRYWRDRLDGAPGLLQLPMDHARPVHRRAHGGAQAISFGEPVSRAVHALAAELQTTPFTVLLACFAALMSRYSGQRDIVVGLPIAGQQRQEFENLIGFFVNTLVLRMDLRQEPSLREAVERAKDTVLGAFAHQDLPFEQLVIELQPDRNPTVTPVFQVLFNYQTGDDERVRLPGLRAELLPFDSGIARFDLELNLYSLDNRVAGTWIYDRDLFSAATIARMSHLLEVLVERAVAAPGRPLARLPVLDPPDLAELRRFGTAAGPAEPLPGPQRPGSFLSDALGLAVAPPGAAGHLAALIGALGAGTSPASGPGSAAALERALAARQRLALGPGDAVLLALRWQDAPVEELLWPLSRGARLILPDADGPGADLGQAVLRALGEHRVHTLRVAPGLLQQVLLAVERGTAVTAPRRVLCCDEPLGHDLEERCLRLWPETELLTAYRRAATGDIARRRCRGDAPAGRNVVGPVTGPTVVAVLDETGSACPVGVPGEIVLAESADGTWPGRTGDLGRFREDGSLELLGTLAEPTLRGQVRIPRGEIEAALVSHPSIGDARVVTGHDLDGGPRLSAYVTPSADQEGQRTWEDGDGLAAALRAHAQRLLPGVLVPASITALRAFPLTGAGLVDIAALPASAALASVADGAPRSRLERVLLDIWGSILERESVGVHDNFFLLGGHSLLAIQVMAKIRLALGLELPVSVLYRYRTVADLAARIATLGPGDASGGRSLVTLQTGAAGTGLALVHPAGGSVFCYASLASALTDRPVHAFEARPDAPSLPAMATAYLDELAGAADVTEAGGCLLGGWSLGGVVAFEMGRQLCARGGQARPLILIDSYLYTGDTQPPGGPRFLLDSFVHDLMADLGLSMPVLSAEADRLPPRRVFGDLLGALRGGAGAGLDLDEVVDRYQLYRANMTSLARYRPAGPYPGEIHLLRATGSPAAAPGWESLTSRLTVHELDGDHHSIMRYPRLVEVARIVESILAR